MRVLRTRTYYESAMPASLQPAGRTCISALAQLACTGM